MLQNHQHQNLVSQDQTCSPDTVSVIILCVNISEQKNQEIVLLHIVERILYKNISKEKDSVSSKKWGGSGGYDVRSCVAHKDEPK